MMRSNITLAKPVQISSSRRDVQKNRLLRTMISYADMLSRCVRVRAIEVSSAGGCLLDGQSQLPSPKGLGLYLLYHLNVGSTVTLEFTRLEHRMSVGSVGAIDKGP